MKIRLGASTRHADGLACVDQKQNRRMPLIHPPPSLLNPESLADRPRFLAAAEADAARDPVHGDLK